LSSKNIAARRNKPNAVGGTTAVPRLRVTIFRAMIESSFFAWVGVAAYTMVNTAFWANSTSVRQNLIYCIMYQTQLNPRFISGLEAPDFSCYYLCSS
jgi:hypothetical protein